MKIENPFNVLQSEYAALYVLGKCMLLLSKLPAKKRAHVIEQLRILAK